jgi:ribose transport system substrate-binding protein
MRRRLPLLVLFTLLGCSSQTATTGPKARHIGAVLPMFSHPFFVAQRDGLKAEAEKLGISIDVLDGQDDDQKQIVQVQALINLGVDAIILCPRDENALVVAIEAANRAKIPVITLNRRVKGGQVVCYVGADDGDGGKAQGEELVRALGPSGDKILYLQGTPGSSPQISRNKGLHQVIDAHPEIVIASDNYTNFQEDTAKSVMSGLVRRFPPGEVRALVAQADELALPAADVALADGWKDLIVIGFNGTRPAFSAIKAGTLHATILQDSADQGRRAVAAAVDHLNGKAVPAEIITPLPVITKANVDKFSPSY